MARQSFKFAWPALLGYDIFISYRRSDGSAYAEKLWRDLKAAGLTPFLDRDETPRWRTTDSYPRPCASKKPHAGCTAHSRCPEFRMGAARSRNVLEVQTARHPADQH